MGRLRGGPSRSGGSQEQIDVNRTESSCVSAVTSLRTRLTRITEIFRSPGAPGLRLSPLCCGEKIGLSGESMKKRTIASACELFCAKPLLRDGGCCLSWDGGGGIDIGNEAHSARIFDEMQNTPEIAVLGLGTTDIYYCCLL